jgi:hypothetical protein
MAVPEPDPVAPRLGAFSASGGMRRAIVTGDDAHSLARQ